MLRDRRVRELRQRSAGDPGEIYAVTLLVTTAVPFEVEPEVVDPEASMRNSDWTISFGGSDGANMLGESDDSPVMTTTRHVRLVQGPDGLGFTVVGKTPVTMQEIEEDGVAYHAGLRVDDQIRAVNGQECTNMAHHEVVGLVKQALSQPQVRTWAPVLAPLETVKDSETDSIASSVRGARSLRVAMLEDK